MIRKSIKILSVTACMLALTACKDAAISQGNITQMSTSVESETTTAQEVTSASESQASQEPVKQSLAPIVSIVEEKRTWKLEGTDQILLEVTAPVVTVENEGFDALSKFLGEKWPGIGNNDYETLRQEAKDQYEAMGTEFKEYFGGYALDEEVSVVRSDSNVVSFECFYYDYCGGAHGNYAYEGITLDAKGGKELELADILKNAPGFYEKAVPYIETKLWEEYSEILFPDYKEWVADTFTGERAVNWYMDATGIVIIYNIYEVGPYVMGPAQITLPYNEFASYIKDEYMVAGDDMVARISANANFDDIVEAPKPIYFSVVEDENYMEHVSIFTGNKEIEVGTFGYFEEAYLIKKSSGRSFLVIVCDYMSTDMVTLVYEVTYGEVTKCMELGDAEITGNLISVNEIEMGVYVDVLGSYIARMKYKLDENGGLAANDAVYAIDPVTELTLIKELPVMIDGKTTTLAVGDKIMIIGTNNVDEVYFTMADSNVTGTIFYEMDSVDTWKIMIDGVWENDYFEMLPYAG